MNIQVLISVLEQALRLWNTKESRRYAEKLMRHKREWYAEFNKPLHERDHAVMDNAEFELRLIGIGYCADAGKPNLESISG